MNQSDRQPLHHPPSLKRDPSSLQDYVVTSIQTNKHIPCQNPAELPRGVGGNTQYSTVHKPHQGGGRG